MMPLMNSYCAEGSSHLPMHVWAGMIAILLVFHQGGLYILEEKFMVLPPPRESKSRRPAVYLLRIVISIVASYLLIPAAIHFYIPSFVTGVQALLSHCYHLWNGGSNVYVAEIILLKQPPSWVCNAELSAALLHCANLMFEMIFAFQMKQRSEILLHHIACICFTALRLTSSHMYFGSKWLWLALGWHLCVYSANFIRSCYSFVSHYLDDASLGACYSPLANLFNCANHSAWLLVLFGYFLAILFNVWNGDFIGSVIMLLAVTPLFYGSSKEFSKSRAIHRGTMCTVLNLLLELFIGLVIVPPLFFLLAFIFRDSSNNFMKKTSHKNTAGGVVSLRALCNAQSDRRLHIKDPYAVRFVQSAISHLVLKSEVLCYLMCVLLETRHPGALGHLITRTRSIDEIIRDLRARKENPIRQLVILGAGYDTRAYRLDTLQDVVVFEVDQEFMSSEKQAKCADLRHKCKELVHLSIDFNNEEVSKVLLYCTKFDPSLPTLFLWEGVQVYLPDASIDRMFSNLCKINFRSTTNNHADHYIYFTLSDKLLLDPQGRKTIYGGQEFYSYANGIGETVQSGLDPSTLTNFLAKRGFSIYTYYPASGLSGHMTPQQKQEHYLSRHQFIRQSEVFHSCLAQCTLGNAEEL